LPHNIEIVKIKFFFFLKIKKVKNILRNIGEETFSEQNSFSYAMIYEINTSISVTIAMTILNDEIHPTATV